MATRAPFCDAPRRGQLAERRRFSLCAIGKDRTEVVFGGPDHVERRGTCEDLLEMEWGTSSRGDRRQLCPRMRRFLQGVQRLPRTPTYISLQFPHHFPVQ